jgi:hypothetical protein
MSDAFIPSIFSFGMEMFVNVILCLPHLHILEADNLFSGFMGPQMEGKISLRILRERIILDYLDAL